MLEIHYFSVLIFKEMSRIDLDIVNGLSSERQAVRKQYSSDGVGISKKG